MGILGELWVKLGLKNEGLNKGLDDSKKKVSGFANYMSKLGGIMAAAFSVKEIISFTHRTAELANKAAGVRKAFQALNNPNLLADLRRATMGTVDDLQLMQRAVQAKNFKIPLDQLATYLQFATKRANETGQSVDYLVDSIITGLGRQSVMILDNLGISAAEIRDNMKDGSSMAEAVGKIIKTQMGDAATEIDKAALATGRLTAAWTNFQMAVGNETSGVWNWVKGKTADVLEYYTDMFNSDQLTGFGKFYGLFNPTAPFIKAAVNTQRANKAAEDEFIGPMPATATNTNTETVAVKGLVAQLEDEIKKKEEIRNLSANEDEIRKTNDEIAALKEKLRILQMTSEEYKKYQESLDTSIKPVNGIFDVPKIKANTDAGLEILNQGVEAWKANNEKAVTNQAASLEAISIMNQAINTGISNSLGELANVIAGVEGANVGSVVKALLSPLADAAISAGLLIMTTGEGIEALRDGLTKFFGIGAIAAGAALMAVGVAAKAGLAAIGSGRTGGGYANQNVTSYSGGYGVNTNNYAQEANSYTLTTTLKGQDLLLAIERTQNNKRR